MSLYFGFLKNLITKDVMITWAKNERPYLFSLDSFHQNIKCFYSQITIHLFVYLSTKFIF